MSMQSITTWTFDPQEPLALTRRFAHLEGTTLLYSGGALDSAQNSFLCLFPDEKITAPVGSSGWEMLKYKIQMVNGLPIPLWVGYLSYEMGVPSPCYISSTPPCLFYKPTVVIHFDHFSSQATLYGHHPVSLDGKEGKKANSSLHLVASSDTLETYFEKIAQIKEWILDGEVYQVNLSQQFLVEGNTDPFALMENIIQKNPAPFTAFINCGDFSIVSSSPERFLRKQGDLLETRPIKGTAPRAQTSAQDHLNQQNLLNSEKEKAELLMITDLMRSDLGKVSLPGTVIARQLYKCESYTNVFHLLSIIESRVIPSLHPVSIIQSLFPAGSITGCPKLSAMHAINTLEKRSRGIYCGSIGYFAQNGDFDFNVAIRTLIVHPKSLLLQLGGAIVIDSDPLKEYQETLLKGHTLFHALGIDLPL